jgi:multidrug efflux pump
MTRLNLSEWALKHRSFVWYLMLATVIAGIIAYTQLGREEDPPFTIKTMIIQANWLVQRWTRCSTRSPTESSASSRN